MSGKEPKVWTRAKFFRHAARVGCHICAADLETKARYGDRGLGMIVVQRGEVTVLVLAENWRRACRIFDKDGNVKPKLVNFRTAAKVLRLDQ